MSTQHDAARAELDKMEIAFEEMDGPEQALMVVLAIALSDRPNDTELTRIALTMDRAMIFNWLVREGYMVETGSAGPAALAYVGRCTRERKQLDHVRRMTRLPRLAALN